MLKKIKFWLDCSRWYALPMSVFSWLIVFVYGLLNDGNALYGVIALIGICFAHLATNLFDDFCDFHMLQKFVDSNNNLVLPNTQRGKCKYILKRKAKLSDVLAVVAIYCSIALLIGLFFYYTVGSNVLIFAGIGALIILGYSSYSQIRLSEVVVGLAFGPLLFMGTYYVMTSKMSVEALILSLPSMFFTVNLLYTDTFLDKDIDKKEGKRTLVNMFSKESDALFFQKILLFAAYLSTVLWLIFDIGDWQIFSILLTLPYAIDLVHSLRQYSEDNKSVPVKKWYHFPFEAWEDINKNRSAAFMFRMYQARNLMIYVSLILSVALFLTY